VDSLDYFTLLYIFPPDRAICSLTAQSIACESCSHAYNKTNTAASLNRGSWMYTFLVTVDMEIEVRVRQPTNYSWASHGDGSVESRS
jgi:hypothetical protein